MTGTPPDGMAVDAQVRRALEAILFVVDEPVDAGVLAQVLELSTADVAAALHQLRDEYDAQERGWVLREAGGGWRLYSAPQVAAYVERFVVRGRNGRLSQAALETLAIVAYRQPVTRAQLSEIRGVEADGALRSLISRGLVEDVGREDAPGQPMLYGTTIAFLERLGLASLGELPPLPSHDPQGPAPDEPPAGRYREARRAMNDDEGTVDTGASSPQERAG